MDPLQMKLMKIKVLYGNRPRPSSSSSRGGSRHKRRHTGTSERGSFSRWFHEDHLNRPYCDLITMAEGAASNALPVQIGAICAFQVVEDPYVTLTDNLGMPPRDEVPLKVKLIARVASDYKLRRYKGNFFPIAGIA
jgi:hypothetical protein